MKKHISILLCALMIISAAVFASCGCASFQSGEETSQTQTISIQRPTEPQITDENGIGFNASGNTLTVSKYSGTSDTVEIPQNLDGKNVVTIGKSAFKGLKIKSVTIPDGVREIQGFAFALCTELESVTIPEGVTSIGQNAFFSTPKLKTVKLPESLQYIEINAFNASGLTKITIPKKVSHIGAMAFSGCGNIRKITFKSNTTVVDSDAFKNINENVVIAAPEGSPVLDVARERKLKTEVI